MDMLSPRAGRTFTVEFLFNDIKGEVLKQRIASSLLLTFAGDALASPAHWYYNLNQLKADHGVIKGYVKPKKHMQGSIMNLSSTSGGGRGRDDGDIIGGVINHGKKKYWQRNGNFHYHCSLEAGESTLEGSLCQLLLKFFAENHLQFDKSEYLKTFEKFMTEPGSHNDTYASTYLRQFFANRIKGKPLNECADNDGHNTDAIDALTCLVPTTVVWCLTHESNLNERQSLHALISDVLSATRKSTVLPRFGVLFADLLVDVLAAPSSQTANDNNNADAGAVLREAVVNCGQKLNLDVKQMVEQHYSRSDPMVACYIDSSFPALLAFAYKYADNPERALLASVNAGGENVARSSALGALLGAAHGSTAVFDGTSPHWLVADLLATNSVGYCISDLFNEQQRLCSEKE